MVPSRRRSPPPGSLCCLQRNPRFRVRSPIRAAAQPKSAVGKGSVTPSLWTVPRVVSWCVADAESAALFRPLFDDAIAKHQVPPGQLTLHADRGGPMNAKATVFLLADLGVTKSHSRPHTSNDNPFSGSH